ncbi:MAG TPA: mannosyltransferase family protein [Chloroflexota bacterium]|nr:mannosyltransferase family protein [Chloroflexota bacterium]
MRTVRGWCLSDILSIFLATRLAFLLLTYFGQALLHDPALVGNHRLGFSGYLLDSWFYRDSQWFLTIVQNGYNYLGAGHRSAVAFFPIYPATVKLLQAVTAVDPSVMAMLVSNAAFLGAMVYMQKLCAREFGDTVARRAVFYMAIFPTAFFTFAPYSESLYLMLSIASLYYMRSERWWLAGIFGGFAAATRILGVLLALPFAWEYLRRHHFDPRRFRLDLLAGALIPGGIGAYMLYLYGLTGDALAFVHAESGWYRVTRTPWEVLGTSLRDIPRAAADHPYFQAHAMIENGLVLACIALLVVGIRSVPFSFTLFSFASLASLLSAPIITSDIPLQSMSRYLLVLAPVYMVLAKLGRWPIFDRLYVLLSAGGLALFTALFVNHMWGA